MMHLFTSMGQLVRRSSLVAVLTLVVLLGLAGKSQASDITFQYTINTPSFFAAAFYGGPIAGPLVDTHMFTSTGSWALALTIVELNLSGLGIPDFLLVAGTLQHLVGPPGPVFTFTVPFVFGPGSGVTFQTALLPHGGTGHEDQFTSFVQIESVGNNITSWGVFVQGVQTPEPGSITLMAIGAVGLGYMGYRLRRRQKQAA